MKKIYLITINKKSRNFLLITVFLSIAIFTAFLLHIPGYISAFNSGDYADSGIEDQAEKSGKLAIIIDDFGQNRRGVDEMMSIKSHLTFAVMPFLTYSEKDAKMAKERGYEVIVHLPLEANGGKISWVGPRPILVGMEEQEVSQIVIDAFENIPYAVGANIHMGSKASSDRNTMSIILDIIKEKGLYFVDSRTCNNPVAKQIADENGVLCMERNVFLDGKRSKSQIKVQLEKAGEIALKKGRAIAIGHVGTEGGQVTAEAITEMLPEFKRKNIKLVFVSELLE